MSSQRATKPPAWCWPAPAWTASTARVTNIAAANRYLARDSSRPLALLGIT
ncbi:hypothetical protein [Micromonospora sp. DT231]|uniref:hypothetical protein n=1 Tax=Micromonospora sp. DT231 TaxID=3416526 RepID=UPI003CF6438D